MLGQQKWEGGNILGIVDIEGAGLDDQVEAESDWGDTWKVAARAVMVQLAQTLDVFIITVCPNRQLPLVCFPLTSDNVPLHS